MKTYKGLITSLPDNGIFVFGSNPQGRHGMGAAAVAKRLFGAENGKGHGAMGRSWGIVTKDLTKNKHPSISTKLIKLQIKELYQWAGITPFQDYYIAYSSKGPYLSGYTPQEMASMFKQLPIPPNIVFEEGFSRLVFRNPNAF